MVLRDCLHGTCSVAVATAVCATGVCDTTDNKCGIALGDGTCTLGAQCRSGACIGRCPVRTHRSGEIRIFGEHPPADHHTNPQ